MNGKKFSNIKREDVVRFIEKMRNDNLSSKTINHTIGVIKNFHSYFSMHYDYKNVVENIGSHALTKSHSRHLHIDYLRNLGLNIKALEDDAGLQDKVLSIHHSTMITISSTKAAKIIENQNGVSFINTIG